MQFGLQLQSRHILRHAGELRVGITPWDQEGPPPPLLTRDFVLRLLSNFCGIIRCFR